MTLLLDTARLDLHSREDARRRVLPAPTAAHPVRLIGGDVEPRALLEFCELSPQLALIKESSSGIEHRRDGRIERPAGAERVAFVLHGGLYVTDLNAQYAHLPPDRGAVRIAQIDRTALGLSAEHVRRAASRLADSPLYQLFREHLVQLFAAAAPIAASPDAAQVASATIQLAASLLRTAIPTDPLRTDFMLERIRLYLRTNYRRRDLGPEFIAYAHNISVRYLYKIWADEPESLMETIYSLRLGHAYDLLRNRPTLSVEAVAAECGFENPSHFSRRFREAYGLSPSQLRRRDR